MKTSKFIAPALAASLLASGCSAENVPPSADDQLTNAYTSCKIIKVAGTDKVVIDHEDGGHVGLVNLELSATRNPQADTRQIHYGWPIGNLLLNGKVTKSPIDIPLGWQSKPNVSPLQTDAYSQTSAYIEPSLELFAPNPFNHVQNEHVDVEVYVSAQNNDSLHKKTSGRYCGTIVMSATAAGGIEANIVKPVTQPPETVIRDDWYGDMHCTITCPS